MVISCASSVLRRVDHPGRSHRVGSADGYRAGAPRLIRQRDGFLADLPDGLAAGQRGDCPADLPDGLAAGQRGDCPAVHRDGLVAAPTGGPAAGDLAAEVPTDAPEAGARLGDPAANPRPDDSVVGDLALQRADADLEAGPLAVPAAAGRWDAKGRLVGLRGR
ncbi:MAG: hypothetical protein GX542_04550 [Rhodococcus sp.]|nr:hypothetical protein [Rhodococcus sp. (in: high G+C Gram-positive bacteria)]